MSNTEPFRSLFAFGEEAFYLPSTNIENWYPKRLTLISDSRYTVFNSKANGQRPNTEIEMKFHDALAHAEFTAQEIDANLDYESYLHGYRYEFSTRVGQITLVTQESFNEETTFTIEVDTVGCDNTGPEMLLFAENMTAIAKLAKIISE